MSKKKQEPAEPMTIEQFFEWFGGTTKVSNALGVTWGAARWWKIGRSKPTPDKAKKLVELSEGRLTMESIYAKKDAK